MNKSSLGPFLAALNIALVIVVIVWLHSPPLPLQPQHDPQSEKKYEHGHGKDERGKSFWERTTTDPVALFTFGLFVFTTVLAASTVGLWHATWRSVTLGRDEFNATHRPKIIVHSLEHATIADDEERLGVTLTYVNIGATRGRIVEIGSTITTTLSVPRPGIDLPTRTLDKWVNGGEWGIYAIDSDIRETAAIIENMRKGRGYPAVEFLCIGYVRYEDATGTPRQTGFCRKFDASNRIWSRIETSDYEYAY
jgi:hypothetical protein